MASNQLLVSRKMQSPISPEEENSSLFKNSHINSSLLPKIHKTSSKNKNHHYFNSKFTKIEDKQGIQIRKKVLAVIVHDYLENFKSKQRGGILAFNSSSHDIMRQKQIQVQGIAHSRFIGIENTENQKKLSLDSKLNYKMKGNKLFFQNIKNEYKQQIKRPRKRLHTDINTKNSTQNLKGYILQAKKSFLDQKQTNLSRYTLGKKNKSNSLTKVN